MEAANAATRLCFQKGARQRVQAVPPLQVQHHYTPAVLSSAQRHSKPANAASNVAPDSPSRTRVPNLRYMLVQFSRLFAASSLAESPGCSMDGVPRAPHLAKTFPQSHVYCFGPQVLVCAFQSASTAYFFPHFSHFHRFSPCFRL
jgi:hypothetical protein